MWTRICHFLLMMAICLPVMSASNVQSTLLNVQPQLLAVAGQQPESIVRVIVQKTRQTALLEETVIQLGGQVIKDLHIINAFAAEMSAAAALKLAKSQDVRWIALDAPVERSTVDEPNLLPY